MKITSLNRVNAIEVPRLLIKALGIKVSRASLIEKLQEHADFPSLLAVNDCFNEWHISNAAYRLSKEEVKLENLKFPFIAQTLAGGGHFMLIHNIENGNIIYSDEHVKRKGITKDDFLKRWSGVAFFAERTLNSGEDGYAIKQWRDYISGLKIPLVIIITISALLLHFYHQRADLSYSLLFLFKLMGLGISILLLVHSVNANNTLVQNLCSLGQKNNCNAILKSEASKATSWISWSEVGFFYFAGGILSLIYIPLSLNILIWLNLVSLPYTFWSIYYQYMHKNWCILCCTVQAILWFEFFVAMMLVSINTIYDLSTAAAAKMLLCFILPTLMWYILKPVFQKSVEYQLLKQQLKKFKYDSDLFGHALNKQPRYAVPDELAPINIGNSSAITTITMVSNPFCGPCAKAHHLLNKWLKTRKDIQLKIVFTTADHEDDQRTKIARHVTALNLTRDAELVEKALNDWYTLQEKKYETWAKDYPVGHIVDIGNIITKQKRWCEMAEIKFTPTILINGYKLPEPYSVEDLPYLIN